MPWLIELGGGSEKCLSEAFGGVREKVAKRRGGGLVPGDASPQEGFVGGGDGERLLVSPCVFEPFENPGVHKGTEGFHDVVGEWRGAFADGVPDAILRIDP